MQSEDDARVYVLARELIARHGDDVAAFLETKIDKFVEAGDLEQFAEWFVIRNAVALTLASGTTQQ